MNPNNQQDEKLMRELTDWMMPDTSPSPVPMVGVPDQRIVEIGEDDDHVAMSEDEISAILGNHISQAVDWVGSEIAEEQAKAMRYYLGEAAGDLSPPSVDDRSDVVDTTVRDQVEWILPSLMEMFFASGNIVRFEPRKPTDEDGAKQMTGLANHVVMEQNPGFQVFVDWFKTAMLNKVGISKCWWEVETTRTRETYTGITDAQLAILTDSPEVTITSMKSYIDPNAERAAIDQLHAAQAAYAQMVASGQMANAGNVAANAGPPMLQGAPMAPGAPSGPFPAGAMPQAPQPPQAPLQPPPPIDLSQLPQLHDVVLTLSRKAGRVAIDTLNAEDFLIAEKSRRIGDGFCAHRLKRTISYLRANGYANVDDISSDRDAETAEFGEVAQARNSLQDSFSTSSFSDPYGDESMREVWLYECYLPIDCDGDGIAEWRKITRAGDRILENVICDGPPFAAICPVSIPGLFYGLSIADLGMPVQKLKTNVLRGLVDNMNLQIDGRTWAVDGQVNIDDLLNPRPGGVVRVKSANAVGALQQGMADSAGAYQLLQYVDTMSQERSGVTKYSQGLDSDTLNHTATGIKNITQRADLRIKLLARTFAETGVKDLFGLIQKLLMNYQDQNMTFKLNGSWVDVDPRVWRNQYSMRANVGLGTGDQGERVAHLMQLSAIQQQDLAIGLATPANLFHTRMELVDALQLGNVSQFFTMPVPAIPQPPKPDPQTLLIQRQIEVEREKAQLQQQTDTAKIQQTEVQSERDARLKAQLEAQHETLLDQRERDKQKQNLAWEREKFYAQLGVDREKAALSAKVFDPAVEIAMNNAIQTDQSNDEAEAIQRELELAGDLLGMPAVQ